jgi:predicted glycoside hydrolase/deacetylase ChbG (UPF0249 family)
MPPQTFLIINADDFGWTESINEGIIDAHRKGILTSATLLANSKATAQAIELAKQTPTLSIGVHLSYNLDKPLLATNELDAIFLPDGRPRFSTPRLWLAATFNRNVRNQLYRHFRSQIEFLLGKDIKIAHLDTHKHVHFWPAVFEIVARLARDLNIPAMRIVRENPLDPGPTNPKARAALAGLSWTYGVNARVAARYQRLCPDRFIGVIQTGYWTKSYFCDIANTLNMKPGVVEIMTHPGYTQGLDREPTRLVESRLAELTILTDPQVKEFFTQCQHTIKRIGYQDLPAIRQVT